MRRAVSAAVLAIAVAACGGSHTPLGAKGPSSLPALNARCGSNVDARVGWFRASDGVLLDGALLGKGKTGVVLAHESPADLCGWVPYAQVLGRAGFRVLLIDHRGSGYSPAPADPSKQNRYSNDLEGAVGELKRDGAHSVFLMGASFGGVTSMAAAPRLGSEIAGVISVSGEKSLGPGDLDAIAAMPSLRVPFLILGSREDGYLPVADARELLRRAASAHKRLVLFPGGDHGWDILTISQARARASRIVIDFLHRYA